MNMQKENRANVANAIVGCRIDAYKERRRLRRKNDQAYLNRRLDSSDWWSLSCGKEIGEKTSQIRDWKLLEKTVNALPDEKCLSVEETAKNALAEAESGLKKKTKEVHINKIYVFDYTIAFAVFFAVGYVIASIKGITDIMPKEVRNVLYAIASLGTGSLALFGGIGVILKKRYAGMLSQMGDVGEKLAEELGRGKGE